jgi:putative tricarboxylic transport membrane protein
VLLAICGAAAPAAAQPGSTPPFEHLRIIAPAAPGGGWDQTARVMQQVLQRTGLARISSVENVPGAAGTIGLARFIGAERGKGDALMASGLIMLGAIVTHRSPVTLDDVTPIARLTGEYEALVVPAASPFRSLADLIAAFKARPESISWCGGSAGGSDQMLAGLVADAVGVAPSRVNYIAFSGGGESLSAILGGQVSVGINGLAEFGAQIEAGTVRVLAVSSDVRLPGLDAPTLREGGVDVVFENWRSVVAPPGISGADRARLERVVDAMVRTPEWREALERYRWLDRYLAGEAFARFSDAEEARVNGILRQLGIGRRDTTIAAAGAYPLLVLAGVALFGAGAMAEARRMPRARQVPPLRPVATIAGGVALHLALAERGGFVIASAILFWFVARAFDDRRPLRDAAVAAAFGAAAFLLFARVLQLGLPAGPLERWL